MAIDQESFNKRLYDIFKTRGYKPAPKDSKNERTNPEVADVFEFQFIKDGENYGKAWATIDKTSSLNIYYDDNQAGSPPGQTKGVDYDDSWSGLLKHLKQWALSKQLNFGLHDSDRLGDDMRQRDYYKMKEKMNEGYHAVNKRTSYNDNIPNVKVVIQHDRQIGEGEQRWRNVHKIFVENTEGERFAVPTRMPGIARVYGRHVAEGGTPYDDRGKHITALVEEYTKMAGFVRATRRGEFNESVAKLIAEGVQHHKSLKETLQKMQSHRGYNHYFESWTPPLMEDESDHTSIAEMFSQESIDPRIESVLPILNKLNSNIINEIEEVNELDQWAKSITEMEQIDEEKRDTHCSAKCCGADVKAADCGCPADCPHCNCNAKLNETDQVEEAIKLPEVTPKMGDNGSNTQSVISGKKVKEEKEGMGSEDDDLRDEESGKNHDPKTGKRTKPHPFDPEDEHLNEDRLNEGAFNKLVVDAMEMSEKEFAKKHPEMAHRYEDILAAYSEDDLKDKLDSPEQRELDLFENPNFRELIKKDVEYIQSQTSNAKEYEEIIKQRISDRKLQIRKLQIENPGDSVTRKRLSSEMREYEKYKSLYDFNQASSAKNSKEASRIEANRLLNKEKVPYTSASDKVSIATALAGMLGEGEITEERQYALYVDGKPLVRDSSRSEIEKHIAFLKSKGHKGQFDVKHVDFSPQRTSTTIGEALIDETDFSDKEIKMAYGILNDPRYKGGNQTGAIKAIEGIKAGLSEHPGVKRAIYKTQNEPDNLEESIRVGKKGFYVNIDPRTGEETPLSWPQYQSTWYDEFKDDPESRTINANKLSLKYQVYLDQLGDNLLEIERGLARQHLASKIEDKIQEFIDDIKDAKRHRAEIEKEEQYRQADKNEKYNMLWDVNGTDGNIKDMEDMLIFFKSILADHEENGTTHWWQSFGHGDLLDTAIRDDIAGHLSHMGAWKGDLREGLDANQKRAGQLGPVGGPAKVGDLVGTESKHADDEMSVSQMSDAELADYVGCSTAYAKANRDECEEVANDKSADHAPDNMLEDILRLSGYDQYKGKSTGKGAGTLYKG